MTKVSYADGTIAVEVEDRVVTDIARALAKRAAKLSELSHAHQAIAVGIAVECKKVVGLLRTEHIVTAGGTIAVTIEGLIVAAQTYTGTKDGQLIITIGQRTTGVGMRARERERGTSRAAGKVVSAKVVATVSSTGVLPTSVRFCTRNAPGSTMTSESKSTTTWRMTERLAVLLPICTGRPVH